ncbi:MAG TPA: hypothetical protein PLJ78_00605 [Anaerolineae bacterium]|nr:hypothetical protein [Anaerolineae bacterium]HQK12426.1 hypothetical protein [Anaerolineae bacterium]
MNATWNDVDISAYVDGQLDPATQSRFETDLATDPTLRQRVDAVREVVTLMRSVPLREPPRNYLLTPAMVAQSVKRVAPRRPPLLMMRLATSLAALAFVVTVGLNLMRQGISPMAMVMEQQQPTVETQEVVVVTQQVELLSAAPTEMAVEMAAPAPAEEQSMKKSLAPAETQSVEKYVEAETPRAELVAQPTPIPAIQVPEAEAGASSAEDGITVEAERVMQPTATLLPAGTPVANDAYAETDIQQPTEAPGALTYGLTSEPQKPVRKSAVSPWGISGILGIVTLCLAGVTYYLSRRR